MKEESGNKIAPEGKIYICLCCGKKSKDMYGELEHDYGWDESCMLNCKLFDENAKLNIYEIPE